MDDGLLELFEGLQSDFGVTSIDDFTSRYSKGGMSRFNFLSAVNGTSLYSTWSELQNYVNSIKNTALPAKVRETALAKLRSRLEEIIHQLQTGAVQTPKKRITSETLNLITDKKIKQLCHEINNMPDTNVLSLAQCIGETLKWTLWYKAKQMHTTSKEDGNLGPLLNEALSNSYYQSTVAKRFLQEFKNNFMKVGYDMVRHSESYIPDIAILNPQIHALEIVLQETFRT